MDRRYGQGCIEYSALQDEWLTEELIEAKLCASRVLVLSAHTWFVTHAEELDSIDNGNLSERSDDSSSSNSVMPLHLRRKWLPLMRHKKVSMILSSSTGKADGLCCLPYLSGESNKKSRVVPLHHAQATIDMPPPPPDSKEIHTAASPSEVAEIMSPDQQSQQVQQARANGYADEQDGDGDVPSDESADENDDNEPLSELGAPDLSYNGPRSVVMPRVGVCRLIVTSGDEDVEMSFVNI